MKFLIYGLLHSAEGKDQDIHGILDLALTELGHIDNALTTSTGGTIDVSALRNELIRVEQLERESESIFFTNLRKNKKT